MDTFVVESNLVTELTVCVKPWQQLVGHLSSVCYMYFQIKVYFVNFSSVVFNCAYLGRKKQQLGPFLFVQCTQWTDRTEKLPFDWPCIISALFSIKVLLYTHIIQLHTQYTTVCVLWTQSHTYFKHSESMEWYNMVHGQELCGTCDLQFYSFCSTTCCSRLFE